VAKKGLHKARKTGHKITCKTKVFGFLPYQKQSQLTAGFQPGYW